jgi:hypothetical protein
LPLVTGEKSQLTVRLSPPAEPPCTEMVLPEHLALRLGLAPQPAGRSGAMV